MLSSLRKFKTEQNPLSKMSAKEVGEHLSKRFPMVVQHAHYESPKHRCSRWILINGPAYQDDGFIGTVMADVGLITNWMRKHAEGVYSSNTAEQQAREYLPDWFANADLEDESVTLLDEYQREVLQGDCLRFLWSDWAKVWCPTCSQLHSRIKEHDYGWVQTGRITLQFDDWHCPDGHLINKEKPMQIRWIVR
jgi:hypothetical protein